MNPSSLIPAARRMAKSLQKETDCARMGSLGDLVEAAEAKKLRSRSSPLPVARAAGSLRQPQRNAPNCADCWPTRTRMP
jgi:hypothetical protein